MKVVAGVNVVEGIDGWSEAVVVGIVEVDAAVAAADAIVEPYFERSFAHYRESHIHQNQWSHSLKIL